jgi:hypothetical protein
MMILLSQKRELTERPTHLPLRSQAIRSIFTPAARENKKINPK